jgi:prepilin signal peptidase PulO-like enzyme (type II secretory pathway)
LNGAYVFINSKNRINKENNQKIKICYMLIPVALILAQAILIIIMLNEINNPLSWIVTSVILIIVSIILMIMSFTKIKINMFKNILLAVLFGSVMMAYLLYQVLPGFGIRFASIYCQFSLLYAIAAILYVESTQ